MNYIKLKKELQNTIEIINSLPKNQTKINRFKTKNDLIQYIIFFEEFEQKKANQEINTNDIKEECKLILKYIKLIKKSL